MSYMEITHATGPDQTKVMDPRELLQGGLFHVRDLIRAGTIRCRRHSGTTIEPSEPIGLARELRRGSGFELQC